MKLSRTISMILAAFVCTLSFAVAFPFLKASAASQMLMSIDTPRANATVTGDFNVSGWALTTSGTKSIGIYVDGAKLGQATTGLTRNDVKAVYPGYAEGAHSGYTYKVSIASIKSGAHTLKVLVTDNKNVSVQRSLQFTIKRPSPAICIDRAGSLVSGNAYIRGWSVDVSGVSRVAISIDGIYLGNASIGGRRPDIASLYPAYSGSLYSGYSFDLTPYIGRFAAGRHTITVTSYGKDGDTRAAAAAISKPSTRINIDSPRAGATVTGGFNVSGWALTAAGTKSIDIYIDGVKKGQAATGLTRNDVSRVYPGYAEGNQSGYAYSVNINSIQSGTHTVKVRVTDNAGSVYEASTTVNKPAPAMSIDRVTTLVSGKASIGGWAVNVSGVSRVAISIDGTYLGDANLGGRRPDVAALYSSYKDSLYSGYSFDLGNYAAQFSVGSHTIKVVAYGNDGQTTVKQAVINKPATRFSIDSPASNRSYYTSVSLRGWALTAGGTKSINVYIDGKLVGNATTGLYRHDANAAYPGYAEGDYCGYSYTIDLSTIGIGSHSVKIIINSGGNSVSSSNITINNKGTITYTSYNISLSTMSAENNSISQSLLNPSSIISADSDGIFEFMTLKWVNGISVNNLATILKDQGILDGHAQTFYNAANANNINPIYFIAHTFVESGHGTSTLANGMYITQGNHTDSHGDTYYISKSGTYYNLFGIHAYDNADLSVTRNDAAIYAAYKNWNSVDAAIVGAAQWISENFINTKSQYYPNSSTAHDQDTLYKMKWDPEGTAISQTTPGHCYEYATGTTWAHTIADIVNSYSAYFNGTDLSFNIPKYIS